MVSETFKYAFIWLVLLPIAWGFVVWRVFVEVFRELSKTDKHSTTIEGGAEFQQTVRFVVKFRKGRGLPKVLCKVSGDVETLGNRSDVNDGGGSGD